MLDRATYCTRFGRGLLLSPDQSRQCLRGGVSPSGRLQGLLPAALGNDGVRVDANAAGVTDAESFQLVL